MKHLFIKLTIIVGCSIGAYNFAQAQTPAKPTTPPPNEKELRVYYMAFLKKGAKRDQDTATVNKIQAAHLNYIGEQARAGKIAIAGPFSDNGDLRGIFILNVKTLTEAEAITNNDPAVKAGRLSVELHPWMSQPGNCLPD